MLPVQRSIMKRLIRACLTNETGATTIEKRADRCRHQPLPDSRHYLAASVVSVTQEQINAMKSSP
jgi:hypothetical protein